jgi:DNA primase
MPEVQSAVERAARGADRAEKRETTREAEAAPVAVSVTMASLPNTRDVALERGAMMAFLQYGHRIEPELFLRALQTPFGHPALEAVRSTLASTDLSQPGWAVTAVEAVREPFRSLAAELLTAEFPARTEEGAVVAANDLSRRLLVRELERQKAELLREVQRVPADTDEGRRLGVRLRDLEADRQRLIAS